MLPHGGLEAKLRPRVGKRASRPVLVAHTVRGRTTEPVIDRYELDALIVHIIHSRSVGTKAPRAPRKLLNWSLDVCRSAGWRTQVALAEARGIPTYVVETTPSSIGPFSMKRGASIMDATRARIVGELEQPASMFRANI